MTKRRTNRIEIDWQDLFKPIPGLTTGTDDEPLVNEIVIKPEIIPIIFVPGIMGSRLKYSGGNKRAWDPDGAGFMVLKYGFGSTPKKRKKRLIGKQSHDPNYLQVCEKSGKIPKGSKERGWGGVSWGIYGKILKALAKHKWPEPLHQCFDFPVYAFGYNWTASNADSGKKLAAFIKETIKENAKKHTCNHVILVTHSMGGLVARAACKLPGGVEDKVLGVVHGVQPATGSPAAYFRMKSGFEPPDSPTGKAWDWLRSPAKMALHKAKGHGSRKILGNSGEEVTVILANSPGGLELLPNQLYKTNDGSSQWLRYTNRHGSKVNLPNSDPYTEIYENQENAYRLINKEWLGNQSNAGYDQEGYSEWSGYIKNLYKAKEFHIQLASHLHPETFQFFSTGIKTADKVEIKCRRVTDNDDIYVKAYRYKGFLEVVDEKGKIKDLNDLLFISAFSAATYRDKVLSAYTFVPPNGSGDGTVPDCSGHALKAKPTGYTHGSDGTVDVNEDNEGWFDRQHDGIYDTKTAQKITLMAVENLCKTKIKKETGY